MRDHSRLKGPWLCCIVLASVLVSPSAPVARGATVDWRNPPQGVVEDRWYAVLINGQRSGYSHATVKRTGNTIESVSVLTMAIQRGPTKISMSMRSLQRETVDGKPLSFEVEQKMSLMAVKMKGVIRDGRVYVTKTQQGGTTKAEYDWDPKAKMSWATALAMRAEPMAVGKTYDLWVYDALARAAGPIRTKVKVVGKESVDLPRGKVEAFKCETVTYMGVPVTSVSYADETGTDLKMTMDMGFIKAEIVACSEAYARKKADAPELFVQTFIKLDRPLDATSLNRIRYRLHVADKPKENMFPDTGMQKVIRRSDEEIEFDVTRIDWSKLNDEKATPVPDDVKPYLQESTFLNAKDPEIIKLARKAVGQENRPARMADMLRRFVTDYVEDKDLSVGLGTATEVARSRQGDCTEHAVLLAAMARAVGIPARCVGGIVHVSSMAGHNNVFGFHMWTQVWIAGQWVDIDAALRQTDCDPSHIAMSLMSLNEDGMVDVAVGILPFIGKTKIDIVETEKPGG